MREGCVPIYWGSEGVIEPEVVNPNSLIYWNRDDGGKQAMKQIAELQSNPQLLHDFISQPRLLPTAEEFVLDTYHQIENKLREIIKNK